MEEKTDRKVILCKDLCEEHKKEYAIKYNMNYELMTSDQLLDDKGFAIFPTSDIIISNDIGIAAIKQQDDKIKTLEETIIKQNQLLEQIIKRLSK